MKTSIKLNANLRNLAKKNRVSSEFLLRKFLFERFLERLSLSAYRSKFILKGGMLVSSITGIDARETRDLDATIKDQKLDLEEIINIFNEIFTITIDDGVLFSFLDAEETREGFEYPGFRITIKAEFDKIRQVLKIDITTGDIITPKEIEYDYKFMFEEKTIQILTYNIETILAEKFETAITRGITNTRMRDFYDIYILTSTCIFDLELFSLALSRTSNQRQTYSYIKKEANTVISALSENSSMIGLWTRYQATYAYANEITWPMIAESIKRLAQSI